VSSVAICAEIPQFPVETKLTTPVELSIVQIDSVDEEYVLVPVPNEAVEVIVGGVADCKYEGK
jgi:hypothetical protein